MPSVAAWLLARPHNAIFALAMTMLVPGLSTLGGAILVLLVLQQDLNRVLLSVALAGLALVVVATLSGSTPFSAVAVVATYWLPILSLSRIMRVTKSLTLALQTSVVFVVAGVCAFFALVNDPALFWQDVIDANPLLQGLQLEDWKSALGATEAQFAGVMSTLFAMAFWFGMMAVLMLGYWLYQKLPGKTAEFGRFCDLNFGRVIALLLAVSSVVSLTFDVVWLQSIAVVVFAVFWLQGVAMVHWLHASGYVPVFVVFSAYALTIFAGPYVFPALAVLGYTDAWFRYRRRVTKQH